MSVGMMPALHAQSCHFMSESTLFVNLCENKLRRNVQQFWGRPADKYTTNRCDNTTGPAEEVHDLVNCRIFYLMLLNPSSNKIKFPAV